MGFIPARIPASSVPTQQEYLGGKYRLLKLLRESKTCQLWEAIHDSEGKRYAIKLLQNDFVHNRTEIGYLRHEFEVGNKLSHPRVIRHYSYGKEGINVYLVMEMFHAPNIKMVIQQAGVDSLASYVTKIITQAAEGLQYFHGQGWIHRDIKPDNYLIKPNGDTKLIDFALAIRTPGMFSFGRFSSLQGTRSYMSPEQIRNTKLSPASDIYSFGCMVFELLAGRPPFTGSSTQDLLQKHLTASPPPVQSLNRNVSEPCANLIRRLLSKNPKDRPKDLDQFLTDFRGMKVFIKDPPRGALE